MLVEGELGMTAIALISGCFCRLIRLLRQRTALAFLYRGKVAAFCALSPVAMPLRMGSVTSLLRSTLDGITTGDKAGKMLSHRWR